MKKKTFALLVLAPLSCLVHGQASLTAGGYSQDFNSLTAFGDADMGNQAGHWTDNSTLQGWYKTNLTYTFDSGLDADAIFLSTGSAGVRGAYSVGESFDSDRSLGMYNNFKISSGSGSEMETGLRLRNDTGAVIEALDVSFLEEHWTTTIQVGRPPHHQAFSYLVGGTSLADSGYTTLSDLDIVSAPQGGPSHIDGNLPENQRLVQGTITGISLAPGQDIWLKWTDWNDTFNNHLDGSLSAMDNLSVQAAAAPVPEPATLAVLGLGAASLLRRRKSKARG